MKIALSAVLALFLLGCSENNTQHATTQTKEAQKVVSKKADTMEDTLHKQQEVLMEKGGKISHNIQDATQEMASQVKDKALEVESVATEVVDKNLAIIGGQIQEFTQPKVDGEKIFHGCAACHGKDAGKSALGKSKIIKGWKKSKIIDALQGYKNGTYGGAMKGIMKGQATKLNSDEIEAVAAYISKL